MKIRDFLLTYLIALVVITTVGLFQRSAGYMDAEYYASIGSGIREGVGFNQNFLWNYLDNPTGIPFPSKDLLDAASFNTFDNECDIFSLLVIKQLYGYSIFFFHRSSLFSQLGSPSDLQKDEVMRGLQAFWRFFQVFIFFIMRYPKHSPPAWFLGHY